MRRTYMMYWYIGIYNIITALGFMNVKICFQVILHIRVRLPNCMTFSMASPGSRALLSAQFLYSMDHSDHKATQTKCEIDWFMQYLRR